MKTLMRPDERQFLIDVYQKCGTNAWNVTPRDIINRPGFYMHYKRAWYLLQKWTVKDWYGYGVSLDLGWLKPAGKEKARELLVEGVKI